MQNFVSYEEQFEYSPEESGPFKCVFLTAFHRVSQSPKAACSLFFFVTSRAELSYSLQPGHSPALQTLGFARVCSHCLRCPPLLCSPDQILFVLQGLSETPPLPGILPRLEVGALCATCEL